MKSGRKIGIGYLALAVIVIGSVFTPAHASKVGDTEEIAALRNQYINAVQSNNPELVGKLVTDDFVMLQPNPEGPDTYGKTAYVEYLKSLNPVVKLTVEPIRVITCGDNWAFELGKEYVDLKSPAIDYSTMARYIKVLNRQAEGWQYARMITALDKGSYKAPPAPGFITNYGYGTWIPRTQSGREGTEAQVMKESQERGVKRLVATGDMVNIMQDVIAKEDESTGEMIAFGSAGELYGFENYMKNRKRAALRPYDDLRKIVEEAYVCDEDTGFFWGQDIKTGKYLITGKRFIFGGDFFYILKKQNGEWKLGPHGMVYNEVEQ